MESPTQLHLQPLQTAQGEIGLPGSKSISNRLLLLAALAQGSTRIEGLLQSDDTKVMLNALRALGVELHTIDLNTVIINGTGAFNTPAADLFLGNAGTAVRPLTATLAVLGGAYKLSGVARMHERPIADLVQSLQAIGCQIDYLQKPGYLPLRIGQPQFREPVEIAVNASVSSQFLSAVLMAAPIIAQKTQQSVHIRVIGQLISKPYIQITLNLMAKFGVQVQADNFQHFTIAADARYQAAGLVQVEGDASSASYFMAMALLGKGPIRLYGLTEASIQGDIAFAAFVQKLGARVQSGYNYLEISAPGIAQQALRRFDEDFNLIPDAAMTAAVLALFADGPCRLRNIASWRVKETDRIAAMHQELTKVGAQVVSGEDFLEITPPRQWQSANIDTYDDHRMAMCFSLTAFGPVPQTILDPGCVAKTFPNYFEEFKKLTVK
ncbi:3-phosphoshikimate 1-carboxyvinyltransferase [Brackiella oedipodis]|uniref:3-phosphoshikimate 1-carboxyvinyltransferase n=1 Tax=Brackiella oedipodis TaxID=124225 RepID=UPI000570983C|nr:3-phosphoshikimate 1-carboxyvinyltransferase [Brackiella oedipodis]